jgi:hypothetical protein
MVLLAVQQDVHPARSGHVKIRDERVEPLRIHRPQGLRAVIEDRRLVARLREHRLDDEGDVLFVVDDEDPARQSALPGVRGFFQER